MQLFVMSLVKMKAHVTGQICVHVLRDGQTISVTQVIYTGLYFAVSGRL